MTEILKNSPYEIFVLNDKNVLINKKFIETKLKLFGVDHKIQNLNLFQKAMIHKSYLESIPLNEKLIKLLKEIPPISQQVMPKCLPLQSESYESLEYLGDAVIHLILAQYLYTRYTDKDPGFLTVLRTKIEKGETLAKLSRILGFDSYAIFARNIELSGGRQNNINIMEDVFEAFMGALSLEVNFEQCKKFMVNLIDSHIDFAELIKTEDNYKEMLMQYYHKNGCKTTPTYKLLELIDEKKKRFVMGAYDPSNKLMGKGTATSKPAAAQIAAKEALIKLGVYKNTANIESDDEVYEYE
jgi:dsRNA-specific ribonuclease